MLNFKEHRALYILMIISCICRALAAGLVELGNDEVYYWTYALFPDWSHFDHPPMVGYMIQIFSLDLLLDHELFLRLSSVIFGTVNTYLIYLIGLKLGDKSTGFFASLLYTGSIYCSVIVGVFIMPDTPLMPLWLLSLYLGIQILQHDTISSKQGNQLLLFGLTVGLAIISKYHAVFLWFGLAFFILLFRRAWLKTPYLYLAILVSIVCLLPVLIWNWENDFISFRFQSERVSFFEKGVRPDRFATEFFGQIFYNNPFNYILTWIAVFAAFRSKSLKKGASQNFLLFTALPLIGVLLFFALFRRTLPHWSGPAYVTLIPLAAEFVTTRGKKIHFRFISWSVMLVFVFLMLGIVEINQGIFSNTLVRQSKDNVPEKKGKYDVTLDMYGWKQFNKKFESIVEEDLRAGSMDAEAPLVNHRWFTAAHLDYYVAHPNSKKLFVFGTMNDIHKYAWINNYRGNLQPKENAYFITHSRAYTKPEIFSTYFESIIPRDTIPTTRSGDTIGYFFVYHLINYQNNFVNPLTEFQANQ